MNIKNEKFKQTRKNHVSNRMLAVMGKYLGWYNIVIARK